MNKAADIRKIVADHLGSPVRNSVLWSRHAVTKLQQEQLERGEVEIGLTHCVLVEDYPTIGRPLPDCLVLLFVAGAPVHATIAIDEEAGRIIVVTVYVPSEERWEDDWKTRR